jgi:hypothetical protein
MRKLQMIGAVLVAIFAFGVLTAASASAVTFLLAEWLVAGAAVTAALNSVTEGELELTDLKTLAGAATVKCSGSFDGWVGPNSLDWISEVLDLTGKAAIALGNGTLSCTAVAGCQTAGTVVPLGLPYETEVELMVDGTETFLVDLLTKSGGGTLGWETECTILGVKITDECTVTQGVSKFGLSGTTLQGSFSEAFTLLAEATNGTCTTGGAESGVVNSPTPGTVKLATGTETLSVSSETTEA